MKQILCISTAGRGQDPLRMRRLTAHLDAGCTYLEVDRSLSRLDGMRQVRDALASVSWDLVYLEGTGVTGGWPCIQAARRRGLRYVVSSGDPVGGFFHTVKGPLWGLLFEGYERLLYRYSSGFIGWTPYLTGAAMKMGAPRAVTVEGAVDTGVFRPYDREKRRRMKRHYGLASDHIVCGVVGSLTWTDRQHYCYGLELVRMMANLKRPDVSVLIVGDGDGLGRLRALVPSDMQDRVVFTGRVPEQEVVNTLNAMDVGFITQTMDRLGRYRLTTKLPEYLAAGLPVAMSPVPGFYDYALDAGWALPERHPASDAFHRELASWIETLSRDEVQKRRPCAPVLARQHFDYSVVRPKFEAFVEAIAGIPSPPQPKDEVMV